MSDPLEQLTPQHHEAPDPNFGARLRERIGHIEDRADRRAGRGQSSGGWHLAQFNRGLFNHPLEASEMTEFVNSLDRINAIAEAAPGFVWRLTDDDGESSSYVDVPGTDDPLIAPNLSVWTDVDSLRRFMYETDHVSYLRRRAEWFQKQDGPIAVLWWIPAGSTPTVEEAVHRLDLLAQRGPTKDAWTFRQQFPQPIEQPSGDTTMTSQVLIPYLTVGDARAAIGFYAEVFGAEQRGELFEMPDGRIGHAELAIGDATFYLADDFPEMQLVHPAGHGAGRSMAVVINVDDCDAVYGHALAAGSTEERPPSNQHGHRSGWFVDPWGHRWCPTSAEV